MIKGFFNRKRENRTILLRLAIRQHDLAEVERLLRRGADPNGRPAFDRSTAPLAYAIKWSAPLEIVEALLKAGADPQEPYRFGGQEFSLSEAAEMTGQSQSVRERLFQTGRAAEAIKGPRKLFRGGPCWRPNFGS